MSTENNPTDSVTAIDWQSRAVSAEAALSLETDRYESVQAALVKATTEIDDLKSQLAACDAALAKATAPKATPITPTPAAKPQARIISDIENKLASLNASRR